MCCLGFKCLLPTQALTVGLPRSRRPLWGCSRLEAPRLGEGWWKHLVQSAHLANAEAEVRGLLRSRGAVVSELGLEPGSAAL